MFYRVYFRKLMGRRGLEPLMFLVWVIYSHLPSPLDYLPIKHARKDSNLNLAVLETAVIPNYTTDIKYKRCTQDLHLQVIHNDQLISSQPPHYPDMQQIYPSFRIARPDTSHSLIIII